MALPSTDPSTRRSAPEVVLVVATRTPLEILPKGIQSMGTHPMFGPDSYNIGSTSNQIVLCPVDITSKNQQKLNAIFQDAHLDTVITTPSDHDKQVAYSLAMVHLIGRTLDRLPLNNIKIKSLGFDRLMKIHETEIGRAHV